jgi:hypothetical protein
MLAGHAQVGDVLIGEASFDLLLSVLELGPDLGQLFQDSMLPFCVLL